MRGGACGVRGNKLLLRTARLICTKIGGFLRTNASMKSLRIFYNCFAGFVVEFPPPDTQPPPEKAPMQNFARLFPLFAPESERPLALERAPRSAASVVRGLVPRLHGRVRRDVAGGVFALLLAAPRPHRRSQHRGEPRALPFHRRALATAADPRELPVRLRRAGGMPRARPRGRARHLAASSASRTRSAPRSRRRNGPRSAPASPRIPASSCAIARRCSRYAARSTRQRAFRR